MLLMFDLIVIGAGPVGLASAIHAQMAGLRACVIEARPATPDKACGEGLMPGGVAALQGMGVKIAPAERAILRGICYIDGSLRATGAFSEGVGWGIRRLTLVRALRARAADLGAVVQGGCSLTGWTSQHDSVQVQTNHGVIHAHWLVGADGLHSKVRDLAGLQVDQWAPRRFGIRRHFDVAPWNQHVEVHWAEGMEAYVTPVTARQVNVAFLWSGAAGGFEMLSQRFPALHARLGDAVGASTPRGAGSLAQRLPRRVAHRVALVGDAAGYLDALTGEGITLGFRCAAALVRTLAHNQPLLHYEKAYRQLSAEYYRSTAMLLAVARRPLLRRLLIRGLARLPGLFDRLLAWHGQNGNTAAQVARVRHPSR